MNFFLNPKVSQGKITILEDSSCQKDFEKDECLNIKKVNSKKQDALIVNSSSVKNKVSEQLEGIKEKESLSP